MRVNVDAVVEARRFGGASLHERVPVLCRISAVRRLQRQVHERFEHHTGRVQDALLQGSIFRSFNYCKNTIFGPGVA